MACLERVPDQSLNKDLPIAVIAAITFCLVNGCATNPAAPAAGRLEIRPPTTSLAVGESEGFALFQVSAAGEGKQVDAAWSIDRPGIATVDAAGHTTAVDFGTATLTASAGGQSVLRSLRIVPDLTGIWVGELRVLEETRVSGTGPFRPPPCMTEPLLPCPKAPLEFQLRQTHDVVTGTGVVLAPLPTGAVGAVTAEWDSISTIRLAGTFRTDEGFETELTEWKSDIGADAASMTDRFTMTDHFTNFWGPQVIMKKCEIVSLARTAR